MRSFASGFIFTTALPPAAAATASTGHLERTSVERERQRRQIGRVRAGRDAIGVCHLRNPSHIVPVMVGDPVVFKRITDILLEHYGIYVQACWEASA